MRTGEVIRGGGGPLALRLLSVGSSALRDDRIVGLERYDFIGEEGLEDDLVKLLGLDEVLILDVTRLRRVDPDKVILPLVFDQGFTEHVADASV